MYRTAVIHIIPFVLNIVTVPFLGEHTYVHCPYREVLYYTRIRPITYWVEATYTSFLRCNLKQKFKINLDVVISITWE